MSRRKISKSAARRLYVKGVTVEIGGWFYTPDNPWRSWEIIHSSHADKPPYYVDLNKHFERTYNETK